jgi:hypothetical protein
MSQHSGEHPRFGACDVCPLVPIAGVTMEETVEYAHQLAERLGTELGLTIYCYENAREARSAATSRPSAPGSTRARREAEGPGVEARLRAGDVQRALRRDRRQRARLPRRLQRQPQHDVDAPRQRDRVRRAREGPHQARRRIR